MVNGQYGAFPADLSNLRILICNDDGIHAPGLKILEKIARSITKDIWIVAPESEQSGVAHSLTLHQPLRVRKISARRYAVNGTPTDCVLLALKDIIPKHKKINLILSGVNPGENMADDITYSGTVAVAMEGTLLHVPSIALSLSRTIGKPIKWRTAEKHAPSVIQELLKMPWPHNSLLNVNFPDIEPDEIKGVKITPMGQRVTNEMIDKRTDPFGRTYYWVGAPHVDAEYREDVDLVWNAKGYITITPLSLDLTNYSLLQKMRSRFDKDQTLKREMSGR